MVLGNFVDADAIPKQPFIRWHDLGLPTMFIGIILVLQTFFVMTLISIVQRDGHQVARSLSMPANSHTFSILTTQMQRAPQHPSSLKNLRKEPRLSKKKHSKVSRPGPQQLRKYSCSDLGIFLRVAFLWQFFIRTSIFGKFWNLRVRGDSVRCSHHRFTEAAPSWLASG